MQCTIFISVAYMMHIDKCTYVHMKYGTVLGCRHLGDLILGTCTEHITPGLGLNLKNKKAMHEKHSYIEKTFKEASIIMNNLINEEIKKVSQLRPTIDCTLLNK